MIAHFFLFLVFTIHLYSGLSICTGEHLVYGDTSDYNVEKNYSFNGMGRDGELVGIICPHVFW